MANRIRSFADLIAPVTEEDFFATYHDRKFLHIPASAPDKFADVMSWKILSDMLNMTSIWSPVSLGLVLDTERIAAEQYCRQAVDRNNQQTWQPDAELVKSWLRGGASLVANDVDTLWPGTAAAANALEARLGGKVQSNLYCSWKQHQAFESHFDTHEVFALHVEGEKVWRIYEGRLDKPIANAAYKTLSDEFHRRNRGAVAAEITLRPGDLLYIPRGQYHDALASSDGCIHLAFGLTHVIGVDVLSLLFEQAIADPLFRSNLPPSDAGPEARRQWLEALGERLKSLATSDAVDEALEVFHAAFYYPRGGFELPADALAGAAEQRYRVTVRSLRVGEQNGKAMLHSDKDDLPIPRNLADPIRWIIECGEFSAPELAAAFPQHGKEICDKLIARLVMLKAIAPLS